MNRIIIGVVARDWLVSLDIPVKRGGRIVYSLNVSFHPARFSELLGQERLSDGRLVHIINERNQFVARNEGAAEIIGRAVPDWYAAAIAQNDFGIVEGPSPPESLIAEHEPELLAKKGKAEIERVKRSLDTGADGGPRLALFRSSGRHGCL